MKKTNILTFVIALLVLLSVAIIALMLMLPQNRQIVEGNLDKYEGIKKTDFTFESTKDISKEALVHEYTVTSEEIAAFRKKNQYKPGNSDPFKELESTTTPGNGNTPDDNTTNGNGGTPNPPATNK